MITRKYSQFLMYNLMESVMVSTEEMRELLWDIRSDMIANYLFDIIKYERDIKTGYNYLGLSPQKNDEILFLPDPQYQRFISKGEDLSKRTLSKISIGRMIGQILRDNGITGVSDKDIEIFVNKFKTAWDRKHGIVNRKIEIVNGENIRKWYNESTYLTGKSTLGNSCMRYDRCQPYLDIYAKNPDKVQLIILTENDRLIARALFWTLDECSRSRIKYYLDRIYVENDSDYEYVQKWAYENLGDKNGDVSMASYRVDDTPNRMKVNLQNVEFNQYPYADTMMYVYKRLDDGKITGDGFISSSYDYDNVPDNYIVFSIRDTGGGKELNYGKFSEKFQRWYKDEDVVYIDSVNDYYPKSECKYCEFNDTYLTIDNAIWSESMDTWIPKDESVETEKWGTILRRAVVNCVDEYIGGLTDPIEVYKQLEASDDILNYFKLSKQLLKRENHDLDGYKFIEMEVPHLWNVRFNDKLIVTDVSGENQFRYYCIEMLKCPSYSEKEFINKFELGNIIGLIRPTWSSGSFVMPEDAKILGVNTNSVINYMHIIRYAIGFKESNYDKLIEIVQNSNLDESEKDKLLKIRKFVHEYLMENYNDYRFQYNLVKIFKTGDKSEAYKTVIHEIYEDIMASSGGQVRVYITSRCKHIGLKLDQKRIDTLIKLLEGFIGFYYLIDDSYDAASSLYDRMDETEYYKILTGWSDEYSVYNIIQDVLRRAFRDGIDSMLSESIIKITKRIAEENNTTVDKIRSTITIRANKYNPF
jgi:hypothetical protein